MKIPVLIHVSELILAVAYILVIWPVYEGEDFLWGLFVCASYLLLISIYSFIRLLMPIMSAASDIIENPANKKKRVMSDIIPWFLFSLVLLLIFGCTLGCYACLPIIVPNSIYLLFKICSNN